MFNSNIIVYTIVLIIDFIMGIYLLESIRFNRTHNSTNQQKRRNETTTTILTKYQKSLVSEIIVNYNVKIGKSSVRSGTPLGFLLCVMNKLIFFFYLLINIILPTCCFRIAIPSWPLLHCFLLVKCSNVLQNILIHKFILIFRRH